MTEQPAARDAKTTTREYVRERKLEIYAGNLAGQEQAVPIGFEECEQRAKQKLTRQAYDHVAGGAGGESTLRANLRAFERWRIVPRMLRNVAERNWSVELFGQRLPAPVLLGPVGAQGILHQEAELASARAAASVGIPFVLSTAGSRSIEQVAGAMGGAPRWYQLYWSRENDITASMVARAERAGYGAIVLTVDSPMLGWRERDLANIYMPFLHGEGLATYFSDPVFLAKLAEPPEKNPRAAIEYWGKIFSHVTLTWNDLGFLRRHTRLPILLKGILHPDDARSAIDAGADGIIVSNHGGRQLDGSLGALEALPEVIRAVDGRVPVLFDSGIRRGPDAVKALALGAKAVLLGRPYAWGLAAGGEQGVREVTENFLADLDVTLALCGFASLADIDETCLARSEGSA